MKPDSGVNFAPVESLRRLESRPDDAYQYSSFHQMVREWHIEISNRNIEVRRQIAEIGRLMSAVRSGKEVFRRDPINGVYSLIEQTPVRLNNNRHVLPLAQINSSQLTSIWTLSRPRATVRHFGNTTRAQIQHALIEQVIQHYDAECFDELFQQQESLSMMDYGCAVLHPFYDDSLNAILDIQPVIKNQRRTVFPGYGFCEICGHEDEPGKFKADTKRFARCPECGEYMDGSTVVDPIDDEVAEIVGHRQIRQGDLGVELRPVPACNWDFRKLVHESEYFQYRSEVSVRFVESVLGIEINEEDSDMDFGLHVLNAVGLRGGSVAGLGRNEIYGYDRVGTNTTIMVENHFMPEWYAGVRLQKAEKTVDGRDIPANTPLEQVFPDGMLTIGFNDFAVLAGAFNQRRLDKSTVYHIQSHSGIGKGTSDSIEITEQLNDAHSAALEALKRHGAGGGVAYDSSVLNKREAQALLKPAGLVGINLLKNPKYTQVGQALQQIQSGELNQSNLTMIAQLSNLMNLSFQTTEFTNGVADQRVDVNTLGGQQLLQAQNQQRSAAPLRMKGWSRARVFEELIELFRENIVLPKFFGANDRFALVKGRFISGGDIPERVKCDFVQDSEIPTNTLTKRQNADLLFQRTAELGMPFIQLMDIKPRLAVWMAQKYGVDDIPLMNQTEILMVCQERLDNLKEIVAAAEMIAGLAGVFMDPNTAAANLLGDLQNKVKMSEEAHIVKASVIQEYLDDDEVKEWSPLMVAAVEALIQKHFEYDRDQRFRVPALDQQGQLALQTEAVAYQQQMMAPQIQAQQEQEILQQGAGAIGEQLMKADDADREEEIKDRDMARQEAQAARDFERQKELERIRQKGRPSRKPTTRK